MTTYQTSTRKIAEKLAIMNQSDIFDGFDMYISQKLLHLDREQWLSASREGRDAWREAAFHLLCKQPGVLKMASRPTVRRWFGLGENAVFPKREHALKMALLLECDETGLQELLQCGIYEPGVQINDYREIIYLYCAANGFSLEKCEDMILLFEMEADQNEELQQKSHTDLLWKMYQINKKEPPARFLSWMIKHAVFFKGYSMKTLKVFREYRDKIVEYVQRDMQDQLRECLEETDFAEWSAKQGYSKPDYDMGVVQYLKNKKRQNAPGVSEEQMETIRLLHQQAYSKMEKNAVMLRELYAAVLVTEERRERGRRISFIQKAETLAPELHFMTDDYVSKLLTVAQQKEKLFQASLMEARTGDKKWSRIRKNQKQRCRLVQREDILPMVQYVAARRYIDLQESNKEDGTATAKEMFENMASEVLKRCDMAPLNADYRLDYILLACFESPEVSYMSEILEIMMEL